MRGHGSQWISNKINIQHPGELKKSKSWEPFWSYQLNSTADLANLAHFEVNGQDEKIIKATLGHGIFTVRESLGEDTYQNRHKFV